MATVRVKLLLGWMPEAEALATLDRCVFDPPLSREDKLALWQRYRDRVLALEQNYAPLELAKLTLQEKSNVTTLLNKLSGMPVRRIITRAIKFRNPGQLLVRQFMVVQSRTDKYRNSMTSNKQRINHCL